MQRWTYSWQLSVVRSGPPEGGDSLLLAVVDLKNGDQLGYLQDVTKFLTESGQLDVSPGGPSG
jgi:hypothetical protein